MDNDGGPDHDSGRRQLPRRSTGLWFSSIPVTAKVLPLIVLIGLGLLRFVEHGSVLPSSAVAVDSGSGAWLDALLLLVAAYGGWDLALAPTGEIKRVAQTIPIALGSGLAVAAALYALTQFVTLVTIGRSPTDRPVAEAASVLIGPAGALFVTIAVMLSTYGNISACILNAPRIIYALANNWDAPAALGKLHSQSRTPAPAIVVYTLFVWLLAASGTFVWALALGAGSLTILYGSICACLFKLPRLKPTQKACTGAKNTRHARNRHIGSAAHPAKSRAVATDGRDSTGCYRKLVMGHQG